MTSRKRLAAAVGELLDRYGSLWIAEALLDEYAKRSEWHAADDRRRITDLETLVVSWLRRDRAEQNKERREWGEPLLPKKEPWTSKRSRKKAKRKPTEWREGSR